MPGVRGSWNEDVGGSAHTEGVSGSEDRQAIGGLDIMVRGAGAGVECDMVSAEGGVLCTEGAAGGKDVVMGVDDIRARGIEAAGGEDVIMGVDDAGTIGRLTEIASATGNWSCPSII